VHLDKMTVTTFAEHVLNYTVNTIILMQSEIWSCFPVVCCSKSNYVLGRQFDTPVYGMPPFV